MSDQTRESLAEARSVISGATLFHALCLVVEAADALAEGHGLLQRSAQFAEPADAGQARLMHTAFEQITSASARLARLVDEDEVVAYALAEARREHS